MASYILLKFSGKRGKIIQGTICRYGGELFPPCKDEAMTSGLSLYSLL